MMGNEVQGCRCRGARVQVQVHRCMCIGVCVSVYVHRCAVGRAPTCPRCGGPGDDVLALLVVGVAGLEAPLEGGGAVADAEPAWLMQETRVT